jgi:hypothetical protein
MPQAKPSQVIVHRIELQQSERQMLKEYVEVHQKQQWIQTAGKVAAPLAITGAVVGSAYIATLAWKEIEEALVSLDPVGKFQEFSEQVRGNSWFKILDTANDYAKYFIINPLDPLQEESGPAAGAERLTEWFFGLF